MMILQSEQVLSLPIMHLDFKMEHFAKYCDYQPCTRMFKMEHFAKYCDYQTCTWIFKMEHFAE